MKNLVGQNVVHEKFGTGRITLQTDAYINVHFPHINGEKRFSFPSCFESFLRLQNSNLLALPTNVKKAEESTAQKQTHGNSRVFEDVIEKYISSVTNEIVTIKEIGNRKIRITNGELLEVKNNSYTYSFEVDDELNFPEGSPVLLWEKSKTTLATIITSSDFNLIIAIPSYRGKRIDSLEMSSDSWRLLEALNERMRELSSKKNNIAYSVAVEGVQNLSFTGSYNIGQEKALEMSITQPITFIWGPPGTGKTETLARIALRHIEVGHKVLMLSYSNISVDGAVLRIEKLQKDIVPGQIIRYGYARDKKLLNHPFLTSYQFALYKNPTLRKSHETLVVKKKNTPFSSQENIQVTRELKKLREIIFDREKMTLHEAAFVATTVSKAVVDKEIYSQSFDVVIFDEASMAYVPQIIFAAGLAAKHFVCMGDFAQLPPIVQSKSKSAYDLNIDIFRYCGIVESVEKDRGHQWLCLLDKQYRMHPDISNIASDFMYHSMLKTSTEIISDRKKLAYVNPLPEQALCIADISGCMSVCRTTRSGSRINILSAFITFFLSVFIAKDRKVGIICPYHAQASLLHAMERDFENANGTTDTITCATVHQFQGSETDVVVFDTVDCYRQRYPSMLLTSSNNNIANRLLNVAVTRARGKFICVSNINYFKNRVLSKSLMLSKLIKLGERPNFSVQWNDLRKLLKETSCENFLFYPNTESANTTFWKDIALAKHSIRIDIPSEMCSDSSYVGMLYRLLSLKSSNKIRVTIRTDSKKRLSERIYAIAVENPYVTDPITIIDGNIIWYGEPLSNANFILEGKKVPTKFYPIFRFVGKRTAQNIIRIINMDDTTDRAEYKDKIE